MIIIMVSSFVNLTAFLAFEDWFITMNSIDMTVEKPYFSERFLADMTIQRGGCPFAFVGIEVCWPTKCFETHNASNARGGGCGGG